jgi:type VI secretion system secreted protein VgrG
MEDRFASYRATLVPWLWFLTRTADCRIFQNKDVPTILKEVFREHGFTDFEDQLSGSYRSWPYCVQYRETDFNFVSRLMEQEGIYYYFKHEDGLHTMVLADSGSGHQPTPGYEQIPYFPPSEGAQRERDHIFDWHVVQEISPGSYALRDYDFQRPKANLEAKLSDPARHDQAEHEIYDYPGEYTQSGDGDNYIRVRLEELQAQYEQMHAEGNAAGLMAGGQFELVDHPREAWNHEYLIISANHEIVADHYESGGGSGEAVYRGSFTCIDAQKSYRTQRLTPKPVVQGPQTAIVVGPEGEEIWTDEYGRVKVQFHWDRLGKFDADSSCWVRVAQVWAGKGWGAIHIPRIDQEVVIEFLEGDPDHPIITGRVYNGEQMPPYELPANKTQSGVKSRSSKGGGADNFNEIRFEDKLGEEQLYIHAEKDQSIVVENDKTEDVGHDETITIGNDRTETVKANETLTVEKDRKRTVQGNEDVLVKKLRNHTGGINETITVGAAQEVTVGAFRNIAVGAYQNTTIGGYHTEEVGKDHTVTINKNQKTTVSEAREIDIGKDDKLTVGKILEVDAGDGITLKSGEASITLKKDGTIQIKGKDITIDGSGNVVIKGSKILQN